VAPHAPRPDRPPRARGRLRLGGPRGFAAARDVLRRDATSASAPPVIDRFARGEFLTDGSRISASDRRRLDDPERLAALRAIRLLDAPAEARFDRLTRLATRVLDVPVAMFSLVDDTRQFWMSVAGVLPEPWAAQRGTPVSLAVCRRVVVTNAPIVVSDVSTDPRTMDEPEPAALGFASYAGVPVRSATGAVLGTICVSDVVPRAWSPDDVALLSEIAGCIEAEIALRVELEERQRAERALEESEARVRELVDFTPTLFQLADPEGRITLVNRAWREVLGYADSELPLLRVTDLVAPELRADYLARVDAALRGETVAAFDTVLLSRSGHRTVVHGQLTVRFEAGVPATIRGRFEDVTESRRRAESAARLVATLDATTDIVLIVDGHGIASYVNRAGRRLLGIDEAVPVHELAWRRFCPRATRRLLLQTAIPAALRDGVWEGETRLLSVTGEQIPVSQVIVAHRSPRGGSWYLSSIMRDISAQKRREQEFSLLQWMTEAISEAEDVASAFRIALDRLCQVTGWPFGEVWTPSADGTALERAASWARDDAAIYAPLIRTSGGWRFALGEGLPGLAWQMGRPVWVRDVGHDPLFHAGREAAAAGMRGAVAIPIMARGELVAVMLFLMTELPPEEEYHVQLVSLVAAELGGVMRRKRADAEMRESEERFRRLSDASNDGIAIVREGRVIEANAAWGRMFGYDPATSGALDVSRLVPPDEREAMRVRAIALGDSQYYTASLRADGTQFDAEVTVRPVVWEGLPAQVTVTRDVTAWRRVSRMKSEFVSTVSHELRTPLTSVRGALGLLEAGVVGPLAPKGLDLVRIARENTDRLIRLINDMLDLDKIEAGKLTLRLAPLAPSDIVRATLDGIAAMAGQFGVRLTESVAAHRSFLGDRDRVVQVLTNLVSNAIKFSTPDADVVVSAREVERQGMPSVRFAVENGGPGIAASDLDRLFRKFEQLDASDTRMRGGTGLGLAISKAIVEQHGGRIGVESEPNVKTIFWFELPTRRRARLSEEISLPGAGRPTD